MRNLYRESDIIFRTTRILRTVEKFRSACEAGNIFKAIFAIGKMILTRVELRYYPQNRLCSKSYSYMFPFCNNIFVI